ncbi:MAG: tetratricopeptide repeat protein [Bacteroidales bacterium]|nr:tetratricopeptide repeat protein [Bacteroidales bacterium]
MKIRILKFAVICFLTFYGTKINAQNQYLVDSLTNKLKTATENQKLKILNELGNEYLMNLPVKALEYYFQALEIANADNNKKEQAATYTKIGQAYAYSVNLEKSIDYFRKSLALYLELNDSSGISHAYNNIGAIYSHFGEYQKSFQNYQKSIIIDEQLGNDMGVARTLNNIGVNYFYCGEYEKALENYNKSLTLKLKNSKNEASFSIANTYANIGEVYYILKEYKKALDFYQKSIEIGQKIKNKIIVSTSLNCIGEVYDAWGNFYKAREYYEASNKIKKEIGDERGIVLTLLSIGNSYKKSLDYQTALKYYNLSLKKAEALKLTIIVKDIYENISETYSLSGSFELAYIFQKKFIILKDSIFNENIHKQISELQTKYETEKIEKELQVKNLQIEKNNSEIKTQKIIIYSLLFFFLLILVFAHLIRKQYQQKKKANILLENQNHEILEKNEELFQQKEEIQTQSNELEIINKELEKHRNQLEQLVRERTAELITAKEKAEESDHLKSAFLANMSHEIRTPMNAIIGFSNLLNKNKLGKDKRKELISHITHSSDTLLNLINDIIDISKIESGQLEIYKNKCYVNEILDELFNIYEEKTISKLKKNIELKFVKKEKEDFALYTDSIRLQQVLINLIDNALKFTEKGFVEIGYNIKDSSNKQDIIFYVKDTGIGLTKPQQKKIFRRFTKLEKERKKLYRGAGLGLSICKSIIELLDGKIWLDSELNKGSTFYFSIPYNKDIQSKKRKN